MKSRLMRRFRNGVVLAFASFLMLAQVAALASPSVADDSSPTSAASIADVLREKPDDKPGNGPSGEKPGNGNNGPPEEKPGNGPPEENPGNGPSENPGNGPPEEKPGNGSNGPPEENPGNGPSEVPGNGPAEVSPTNGPPEENPGNGPLGEPAGNGPLENKPGNGPPEEKPGNGPPQSVPVGSPGSGSILATPPAFGFRAMDLSGLGSGLGGAVRLMTPSPAHGEALDQSPVISQDPLGRLGAALPPGMSEAVGAPIVVFEVLLEALTSTSQSLVIPGLAMLIGFALPGSRRRDLLHPDDAAEE